MKRVASNVAFIPESMVNPGLPDCNIYVLGTKDEFYLVDTGNGFSAEEKVRKLTGAGFDLQHCRAVILTHSHFDHMNGAARFDCPVYAHTLDAVEIEKQSIAGVYALEDFYRAAQRVGLKLNAITISKELVEGDVLPIAGEQWHVLHTPGHTPGGLCLYRNDGTLVSGDTLFSNSIGRTDFLNSNSQDMKASLKRLAEMNISVVLPGHGEILENSGQVKKIVDYFMDYL